MTLSSLGMEKMSQNNANPNCPASGSPDLRSEEIMQAVNCVYVARRFFGRSGCWFSQKLNRHLKNGKPCKFTSEELKTMSSALRTIAREFEELADKLQ